MIKNAKEHFRSKSCLNKLKFLKKKMLEIMRKLDLEDTGLMMGLDNRIDELSKQISRYNELETWAASASVNAQPFVVALSENNPKQSVQAESSGMNKADWQHAQRLRDIGSLPVLLIEARVKAGLSQTELARRMGLRQQAISRYENGNYREISFARLANIANLLEKELNGQS